MYIPRMRPSLLLIVISFSTHCMNEHTPQYVNNVNTVNTHALHSLAFLACQRLPLPKQSPSDYKKLVFHVNNRRLPYRKKSNRKDLKWHNPTTVMCPHAGCKKLFDSEKKLNCHLKRVHDRPSPSLQPSHFETPTISAMPVTRTPAKEHYDLPFFPSKAPDADIPLHLTSQRSETEPLPAVFENITLNPPPLVPTREMSFFVTTPSVLLAKYAASLGKAPSPKICINVSLQHLLN